MVEAMAWILEPEMNICDVGSPVYYIHKTGDFTAEAPPTDQLYFNALEQEQRRTTRKPDGKQTAGMGTNGDLKLNSRWLLL